MKEGWEERKLGDVCVKSANIKWEAHKGESFQYIDLSAVSRESLKITESSLVNSTNAPSRAKKIICSGDVLFATTRPTLRRAAIVADEYDNQICSTGFTVLRPNTSVITTKYIHYILQSESFMDEMKELQRGASYPAVTDGDVKGFSISVPSLEEQKQIVAVLDKAFAAIDLAKANIEKNLQNAKELFQSKLNEIFTQKGEGWEEKKLADVCGITSKLIDPREGKYLSLLHVGGANITSETGELIKLKTSKEEALISGKFIFDDSMVLYSKIRPYLVKVCRPDFTGLCSADIYPLLPNEEKIKKDFLYYLLISKRFTDYAMMGSARAGMPKVNRKHLFNFDCIIPSIAKQSESIKLLNELQYNVRLLERNNQARLNELSELKKSILQKAFSGELEIK